MLTGIALILLTGMFLGFLARKIKLPALVGMILAGILLGPSVLGILDPSLLEISPVLRKIALVIILTRAGLSLDIKELKKAGRPSLLMCFVPAALEIGGTTLIAPLLFNISHLEAAVIGSILAAVSPAVVVPRMIGLINEKRGTDKQIPQIILAGASADDVFAIVMFTSLTGVLSGGSLAATDFIQIPTSILLGISCGVLSGALLAFFFTKVHIRDTAKVIILMSVSFLLTALEDASQSYVRISGLIAIMAAGMAILYRKPDLSKRLSTKYNKLWVCAEIALFALVGAETRIETLASCALPMLIMLICAMACRMTGVFICLIGTKLNLKERLFCMLAYTPKATVQAAIGAIPLSMGLACGELALAAAVIAIIITAPFGAFMIDTTAKRLLKAE